HHHAFALENLAAVGGDAEAGIAGLFQRGHHLVEMKGRVERLDLLHQGIGQAVAGDVGDAGNVVDRLLGIELGALAADLVEDVDEMRLDVEQAELEHGEEPHRPRADNENVGFNGLTHYSLSPNSPNSLASQPSWPDLAGLALRR